MNTFASRDPGAWHHEPVFWTGVLHDLRNVLAIIAGHTDLMLRQVRDVDPIKGNLDAIRRAADSGNALMQQLVNAVFRARDDGESVNVNAVAETVVAMIRGTLPPAVRVRTRLEPSVGQVELGRAALEQVLINLVLNAGDAMPGGGDLTIETANVDIDAAAVGDAAAPAPGSYVLLVVRDTGRGIEADARTRLFDPSFTTKATNGHGMGLAMTRLVVTRHGGAITASGGAGEGATFRVYLRRMQGASDPDTGGRRPEEAARETVLIVDDETDVRELVREILELHRYAVLDAQDTNAAIDIVRHHAGPIHLVIADVSLPGMTPVDFRRALRESRPDARVLYISGHSDDEIIRRVGPLPGPVLQKPFAVGTLADKVRQVLDARE